MPSMLSAGGECMSHHRQIRLSDGTIVGHLVMTNLKQVLAVVIHQPWGDIEVFYSEHPEIKEEEE